MTWFNDKGEELEYTRIPGSNLSLCPHGTEVYWADECDKCMKEYK